MYIERIAKTNAGLTDAEITDVVERTLEGRGPLRRVLILPPDFTRYHSKAGFITCEYYRILTARGCRVDVMPALGTHEPVSRSQWEKMYPAIPYSEMIVHHWRGDVIRLGEVPAEVVSAATGGKWTTPVACELNRRLLEGGYDLIVSPGQVVPHEVIGMSNESKNLFVGVGGSDMINQCHMIAAVNGVENHMGRDHSPVRRIFDYCLERFIPDLPLIFFLTVTTARENDIFVHGVFVGRDRRALEGAVALASEKNITLVEKPIRKCVAYLPEEEFRTTWVGNKAIYRTRMAMADGGELLILGPGVERFGEDPTVDDIIRRYGYPGSDRLMEQFRTNRDMQENMGAVSHLIMSCPDGRFSVTYAVRDISEAQMRSVHFGAVSWAEASARYDRRKLAPGWNTMPDGEEIYFVPNPALGLWASRGRFAK